MAFNRSSHRQNVAIILSSMGFLLWGMKWFFTPNLKEEAHGFNKWQLGLSYCHLANKAVTRVYLSSPGVIGPRPIMSRLPHIPHVDIPRAVLELADLSNVHPAPIVANLH